MRKPEEFRKGERIERKGQAKGQVRACISGKRDNGKITVRDIILYED